MHAAAGPELADELDRMREDRGFGLGHCAPAATASVAGGFSTRTGIDGVRQEWRGSLLPSSTAGRVVCLTGTAVHTPSFGSLREFTRVVVHAVAPDGLFRSSPGVAESRLRGAFSAALAEAGRAKARSVAIPSMGCGVHSWAPARVAHEAIEAAAEWMRSDDSQLQRLDYVLACDATWDAFRSRASARFGEPAEAQAGPDGKVAVLVWPAVAPQQALHQARQRLRTTQETVQSGMRPTSAERRSRNARHAAERRRLVVA